VSRFRCTPARDCRAPGYDGAEPSHRGLLMPSSFTRFKTHAFPLRRRQWLVHRHRRRGSLGWPTSASTWTAYVSHVLLFFLLTIHPQVRSIPRFSLPSCVNAIFCYSSSSVLNLSSVGEYVCMASFDSIGFSECINEGLQSREDF
jgi:hypothetical protein